MLHLVSLTESRALCSTHQHDLIDFFPPAFIDSWIARVNGLQILEQMVVGSSALCSELFAASLFFLGDAAEPSGAWARNLSQLGRRHMEAQLVLC